MYNKVIHVPHTHTMYTMIEMIHRNVQFIINMLTIKIEFDLY